MQSTAQTDTDIHPANSETHLQANRTEPKSGTRYCFLDLAPFIFSSDEHKPSQSKRNRPSNDCTTWPSYKKIYDLPDKTNRRQWLVDVRIYPTLTEHLSPRSIEHA
ncbi:hypothetical protein AVEN_179975-1 [Araneus ventricosus]|uniref:Uncharacterized protein n=1 Tax=Araneus ventricosus TaxID=182803 RepID=A0A4Y2T7R4_ARAVE|nr:hypothetical protein AVEN_179975-1 [Araneus ventricosus]